MSHKTFALAWVVTLTLTLIFFAGSVLLAARPTAADVATDYLADFTPPPRGVELTEPSYRLAPLQTVYFLRSTVAHVTAASTVRLTSGLAWLSNLAVGETATLSDERLAATSHGGAIWLNSQPASTTVAAVSHPLEVAVDPTHPAEFVLPPALQATVTPRILQRLAATADPFARQMQWLQLLRPVDLTQPEIKTQLEVDAKKVAQILATPAGTRNPIWLKLKQNLTILPAAQARVQQQLAESGLPQLLAGQAEALQPLTAEWRVRLAPFARLAHVPGLDATQTKKLTQSFAAASGAQKMAGLPALPAYVTAWQTGAKADGTQLTRAPAFGRLFTAQQFAKTDLQNYLQALPPAKAKPAEQLAALAETAFLAEKLATAGEHAELALTLQHFGQLAEAAQPTLPAQTWQTALRYGSRILQLSTGSATLHGAAESGEPVPRPATAIYRFMADLQQFAAAVAAVAAVQPAATAETTTTATES